MNKSKQKLEKYLPHYSSIRKPTLPPSRVEKDKKKDSSKNKCKQPIDIDM